MKNMSLKKLAILGFFFISIVGTLSHFIFAWSGYNSIIGAFTAVNESVWEHLKIAVIPGFIWMLITFIAEKDRNNFFFAKIVSFLTIMVSIVITFYGYTAFFEDSLVFDISSFYIAIALGQYVSYKIMGLNKFPKLIESISKVLLILLFLDFVLCTYNPPACDIFKDPITNGYGINNLK